LLRSDLREKDVSFFFYDSSVAVEVDGLLSVSSRDKAGMSLGNLLFRLTRMSLVRGLVFHRN